jgi:protein-disulfide isomerase
METNELTPPTPAVSKAHAWVTSVPLAILVAAAMVSGSILYIGSGGIPSALIKDAAAPSQGDVQEPAPVAIDDPSVLFGANDPVIGNAKAKVTIVEFSDFQCPFCRKFFNETYAQIKKEYIDTGKARMVFRHYPLPFHDAAKPSALAAACANEQNKFWQFHDKMFQEQDKKGTGTVTYGVAELKTWAAQVGVNATQFNACLDSAKYASKVDVDTADGAKYGVNGTPSFFINGKLLVGAQPFEKFKAMIDAAL